MTESITLPLRNQVLQAETWDLESIFATPADVEAAGQELTGYVPRRATRQGSLREGHGPGYGLIGTMWKSCLPSTPSFPVK